MIGLEYKSEIEEGNVDSEARSCLAGFESGERDSAQGNSRIIFFLQDDGRIKKTIDSSLATKRQPPWLLQSETNFML